MGRYRIIGKSKHITSVYLKAPNGEFCQHRMISGKQLEVDESELTFHVARLVATKDIQLVKLDPPPEPEPVVEIKIEETVESPPEEEFVIEETPAVEITEIQSEEALPPKSKKGRGRKKKTRSDE